MLVETAVELIIPGLSLGDLEKQRQEDEEDWDYNRTEKLNRITSRLLFWRNTALKDTLVLSGDTIRGI